MAIWLVSRLSRESDVFNYFGESRLILVCCRTAQLTSSSQTYLLILLVLRPETALSPRKCSCTLFFPLREKRQLTSRKRSLVKSIASFLSYSRLVRRCCRDSIPGHLLGRPGALRCCKFCWQVVQTPDKGLVRGVHCMVALCKNILDPFLHLNLT